LRRLPTGTVAFLFSDIEGSTRRLDELGATAYADALAEHRCVLPEAFAGNAPVTSLMASVGPEWGAAGPPRLQASRKHQASAAMPPCSA
jgi:hypothetical protein